MDAWPIIGWMPTPKKSLADLIWDQRFLARRHAHLLRSSKLVEDDALRELQQAYRAETSERERRARALDFEKAVRDPMLRSLRTAGLDSPFLYPPPNYRVELLVRIRENSFGPRWSYLLGEELLPSECPVANGDAPPCPVRALHEGFGFRRLRV
jgi:hypothetical protein